MTVYLAGPIFGKTDSECKGWREVAESRLPKTLNPMRRDYRGSEHARAAQIVEDDLNDILLSDVVLVNAEEPSWGTAMEIAYAHHMGKRIVGFASCRWSPWLVYHAEMYPSLEDALQSLEAA